MSDHTQTPTPADPEALRAKALRNAEGRLLQALARHAMNKLRLEDARRDRRLDTALSISDLAFAFRNSEGDVKHLTEAVLNAHANIVIARASRH